MFLLLSAFTVMVVVAGLEIIDSTSFSFVVAIVVADTFGVTERGVEAVFIGITCHVDEGWETGREMERWRD